MTILPSSTASVEGLTNIERVRLALAMQDAGYGWEIESEYVEALLKAYDDLTGLAQPFAWALTWPDGEVSFTRREPDDAASLLVTPLFTGVAQAKPEPVARAHISLEDDGPYAKLEVLNGELLQPSMSPVNLYAAPQPATIAQAEQVPTAADIARELHSGLFGLGAVGPATRMERERLIAGYQRLIDRFEVHRRPLVPSTQSATPCAHAAIIGLDGCWHCQKCGASVTMGTAQTSTHLSPGAK